MMFRSRKNYWVNGNVLKLWKNVKLLLIFEVEILNELPKVSSSGKLFTLVERVTETNCDSTVCSIDLQTR